MRERAERTATSAFGVGRREGHDSSGFYERFQPPEISSDTGIESLPALRQGEAACIQGNSSTMVLPGGGRLPANSVGLVVTSPPYFVGKEYEQALGQGSVPETYLDYLDMLTEVFAECKRVLEPGGRIAVNVANLGRKPYRSLSADVIDILQNRLHLLLRGEVIWRKAEGASGSCAWGSFRSAANPVLRDVTERVVIASKGRFDRALSIGERRARGLPHENDLTSDEFVAATLDVWDIQPESARRVNHPAPFPVELPQRLIGLYTYRNDIVVDPFMGSGSTLVAAARSDRRYLGYDLDPEYVATARRRIREEQRRRLRVVPEPHRDGTRPGHPQTNLGEIADDAPPDSRARANKEGKAAQAIAEDALGEAGFRILHKNARQRGLGVAVSFVALDADDTPWYFDVSGAFTATRDGLLRTDTLWKSLGRANVLVAQSKRPLVLLTSHLPKPRSEGDMALRAVGPGVVFDALELLSDTDRQRLKVYAAGARSTRPLPGFWDPKEIPAPG
ncbi:MAG TPA: site-specific DNA-methyltransferase [Acidimicrobiales bacterium]|nr:site-specific DNA-methyltransferase [Acidimicrobiales bacterium]